MDVNIKLTHVSAVIPTYAKPGDAGMDLTAVAIKDVIDKYVEYDTGISLEIPVGYVGLIFPRSSLSNKDLILANHVGVIDSSYRGNVLFRFKRTGNNIYKVCDRIGQIIIIPYPQIKFNVVDRLSDTERGDGCYGHSG